MSDYPYPHCPVCGNDVLAPFQDGDTCPCCAVTFGLDDRVDLPEELREGWAHAGMDWWSTHTPAPPGWDPEKQLQRVMIAPKTMEAEGAR
jgi:tRNA(Ile2) C34 agmatinyltransferase TiaS